MEEINIFPPFSKCVQYFQTIIDHLYNNLSSSILLDPHPTLVTISSQQKKYYRSKPIQRTLSRRRKEYQSSNSPEDLQEGAPVVNISRTNSLSHSSWSRRIIGENGIRVRGEAWEPTAGSAFREAGVDSVIGLE